MQPKKRTMINDLNLLEADCLSATPQHFKLFLIALHPMQLVNYFFLARLKQAFFWLALMLWQRLKGTSPKVTDR